MSRLSYQRLTQLAEEQIAGYRDEWMKLQSDGWLRDKLRDQAFGTYMLWYRSTLGNPQQEVDDKRLSALVQSIGKPVEQPVTGAA